MTERRPASLAEVDLGQRLDKRRYHERKDALKQRLRALQLAYWSQDRAAVLVFEGWDAAGKGGTIRRLAAQLDPRGFAVWSVGAPNGDELRQHYLQRFWTRLPEDREIAAFDRSWYGRVLVERVEQLTAPADWRRAYQEINAFEALLTADGTRVVKLFMHISLEEQKRRLQARLEDPLKHWKLAPEDFRNLELRDAYAAAIDDMLAQTSTADSPWHLIAAEDKRFGRIAALEAVAEALAEGVDLTPQPVDPAIRDLARRLL
ncbi:MAG: polyphosphate kinase [Tistlia sp.]|uniref:polyphosphate kinase 2 family protein n=1 Tax=Tistlia sp. TaxID=3057121 RepID=UPI0034A23875